MRCILPPGGVRYYEPSDYKVGDLVEFDQLGAPWDKVTALVISVDRQRIVMLHSGCIRTSSGRWDSHITRVYRK